MEIIFDLEGVRDLIAFAEATPQQLRHNITKRMKRVGEIVHSQVMTKFEGPGQLRRTGTLARSIFDRVLVSSDAVVTQVGAALEKAGYARIQELGGTITPKNGQFLAIPIGPALTAQQQVARFSARDLMANPQAFGYKGAFVKDMGTGRKIFGEKERSIVALFKLVRGVTLRPQAFLASSLLETSDAIDAELDAAVEETLTANPRGQS